MLEEARTVGTIGVKPVTRPEGCPSPRETFGDELKKCKYHA